MVGTNTTIGIIEIIAKLKKIIITARFLPTPNFISWGIVGSIIKYKTYAMSRGIDNLGRLQIKPMQIIINKKKKIIFFFLLLFSLIFI